MSRSPLRQSMGGSAFRESDAWSDDDLVLVFVLVWLVSAARVIGGLMRGETLGTEATLALFAMVCLPWVLATTQKKKRPRGRVDSRR